MNASIQMLDEVMLSSVSGGTRKCVKPPRCKKPVRPKCPPPAARCCPTVSNLQVNYNSNSISGGDNKANGPGADYAGNSITSGNQTNVFIYKA